MRYGLLAALFTVWISSISFGLTFSGHMETIMDIQTSNRNGKFGYLMRHPTSANQSGHWVSEAILHEVQLHMESRPTSWAVGSATVRYNPSQSFAGGSIVDVQRNQIELSRGEIRFQESHITPWYARIGKLQTPFGHMGQLSPFSESTMWHVFGGVAYGAEVGYLTPHWDVVMMAAQGGAQFRGLHSTDPTPSQLDNGILTLRFRPPTRAVSWEMGVSYELGSAYCTDYPITHFGPCSGNANPAWDVFSTVEMGPHYFVAEVASTVHVWPGSASPTPPLNAFPAHRVQAISVGYRYAFTPIPITLSAEFSEMRTGPDGSPWERQNQWVMGLNYQPVPQLDLFAELIHVQGYQPLNFMTGPNPLDLVGGQPNPASTWSDASARTTAILMGSRVSF